MVYTKEDYERDKRFRERERAREGRLASVELSERDLQILLVALESLSAKDDRVARLYYRLRRAL